MASKFSQEEKLNSTKKLGNQVIGTENAGIGFKPYYAEEFSWTPIINPKKIWLEIDKITGATNEAQAISVAASIPFIIKSVKVRLTVLNTSNYNAYIARSIFEDDTSTVLDNWLQPQLIRTINNDTSLGYSINLYNGDPDNGGSLISTNFEGLDGEPSWEWSYSSGILIIAEGENTTYRSFYDTNGLWVQGFRYIGKTVEVSNVTWGNITGVLSDQIDLQNVLNTKGDRTELDRLKWIDLLTTWTAEPVNVAYSDVDGEVIQYTYGTTIYYRFVPTPYDSSLDAFYTTYSNPTLNGLITTRATSI